MFVSNDFYTSRTIYNPPGKVEIESKLQILNRFLTLQFQSHFLPEKIKES